ncbi:MAG: 6-phosphofructokinase, partial [Bacillus sp. (in: firmicutes)]
MFKNAIIGQSGGPTAVINASLYGVIKEAMEQEQIHRVYGMKNGIEGLLKGNILDLKDVYETKNFDRLKHTPASFLGSCRFKLPEIWDETYQNIFQIFKEYEIGYFFYIGGNDSMDTVSKLSAYAKEIGFNIKIIG